jgi:hypothetical protein
MSANEIPVISDSDNHYERRMAAVIERLTKAGYTESFKGEKGGVRAVCSGHLHAPEELVVESIERFEGASDPDEMVIILALSSQVDSCHGTYTVPFGRYMSKLDGDLIERIPDARKTTPAA